MEMGGPRVPSRVSGGRRYKAVAPWRFQPGFVRQKVKSDGAPGGGGVPVGGSDAMGSGLGALGSSGKSTMGGQQGHQTRRFTRSATAKSSNAEKKESGGKSSRGGQRDHQTRRFTRSATAKGSDAEKKESGSHRGVKDGGDLGKSCSNGCPEGSELENLGNGSAGTAAAEDCGLGRSNCDGTVRDTDLQDVGSGGSIDSADRTACNSEESGRNAGVEKCSSEGLKKSCVNGSESKSNVGSAADCISAKNGGGKGCGSVQDSDAAAKGCSLAGPGSNGNGTNCRKGRKAVAPWRFQIGYKRSLSEAFCAYSGSFGSLGTPEHRVQGSSTQCSPATRSTVRCYASAHSSVRVSAMSDFSSVKGEKETSTAYKKRKTNEDDHNQVMPSDEVVLARENIMRYLQDFRLIYKDLLDKEEHKSEEVIRPDLQAYRIFKGRSSVECDDKKYVGNVPGIHAGDMFHLRVELCIAGLHRPHRVGVDHIKVEDGTCIAISIVSYARSSNVKNNLDVLVYAGSMAATGNQKIQGTNLALKKSMDTKTPVRVIHGLNIHLNGNCRLKKLPTYVYGGLYQVEKYWREKEKEDRYVYMFRLRRMAGQKHIDIQEILKSRKGESNDYVIMKDLSKGLERIPISVVNSISDEYPMPYQYISRLQYPCNYQPAPPAGCGCVGGCSDSKKCACAVKNGGEIPFNEKGCILQAKPLVYECGPSCKCPPTCHNRVGQKGIKFRLQVFKTKLMGWGVRTLDYIPSGSFVCEYIGEVLEEDEAQKRMTDEYLFAIGHNYYDEALWEGLSRSIPSLQNGPGEDEEGFAVDASKMGNFTKFINHSCTPNLYAQNVLYDHDDKSVPHIMFFASEDIPPHQELAYHYNYTVDQVHDVNGNIKKKKCLCGSIECDGWLY